MRVNGRRGAYGATETRDCFTPVSQVAVAQRCGRKRLSIRVVNVTKVP
jgi:hypothetical protein